MADEQVEVKFGGNTDALDQASKKSVEDIGNVGKAAAGLTTVFRNLLGVTRSSFGGAMFAELKEQIGEVTEKAKEAGTEAIGMKELFGLAFGGVTAALSLPALVEFGEHMGEMVEKTGQQAQKLGIAATTISAWGGVMTLNGLKNDQFVASTTRLERSMSLAAGGAKAQKLAFSQLGIEVAKNANPTETLLQIADKFKGMDDGPKKIALAMQLMGRGGTALIPVLNQGSDAIKEQMQEANDYGATMDEQFIQKGERVAEAFNEQKLASQGLKNMLFDEFAPVIASVVEYFNSLTKEMIQSYREGGVVAVILGTIKVAFTAVVLAIETVVTGLKELWTMAVTVCAIIEQAFVSLGSAIYDALSGNFEAAKNDIVAGTGKIVEVVKNAAADLAKTNADYIKAAGALLHGDGKEHKPREENGEDDISSGGGGKGAKAKDDRMQQWQAELTAKLEAEKNYFGDSKAEELAFWQEKLALTTAGSKAQQQVTEKIYQLSKGIAQDQYRADMENFEYKKQLAKDDFDTQMSIENEKNAEIKKLYGADSAEYLKAVREKETMERDHQQKLNDIAIQGFQHRASLAEGSAQTAKTIIDDNVAAETQHNQSLVSLGQMSATQQLAADRDLQNQKLAAERAFEQQMYQIKLQALQDELALANLSPEKTREVNASIELLTAQHNNTLRTLNNTQANQAVAQQDAAAQQVAAKWKSVMDPVTSAFSNAFQSIFNKSQTVGQAMKGVFVSLGNTMIDSATKAAEKWIMKEISKTAIHAAQSGIRATTDATAATASAVTQATQGVTQVMSNAAIAASAAFASTAAIPIIGPALAPEAATAAYAATAAFAPLASASQGYDIPSGVNPLTQLHEEEMVLPASIANPMRGLLGQISGPRSALAANASSAGLAARSEVNNTGGNSFHYNPQIDHSDTSLEQLLRREGGTMRKWLGNQRANGHWQ